MVRNELIRAAFFTAIAIAALHVVAVTFFLYSFYWWFDLPLHFLAGLCTGFLSIWACFKSVRDVSYRRFAVAIGGALVFGLVWEFFEYYAGLTQNGIGNYSLDTVKDLAVDVLGACAAYLFTLVRNGKSKRSL